MTASLARRGFLAGALGAFGQAALFRAASADAAQLPSAADLARPVDTLRAASGLLMTDETGARVDIARYTGETLLVALWAPWCLPCRREMPAMARLAARLGDAPVRVLPLAFDWRGAASIRRFYRETGVEGLPILLGDGENLVATLGVEQLPTTVVIDAKGRHVATVTGEAVWDDDATLAWMLGFTA
ncbi:TlpA disulfide reductase family protein [Maritimibacter sp. HL-12]|uniref:TlpA family protein disulfide reductase n=1 Tax=Maritimibacter sp. HL-12 TaxID=1162418 RepID=UPI000A0EFE94|nr:TlpA disulfide reductase family protein [Maritimibacter sp. HL-12]SMH47322.1 Thiol-disulfide isomerase or thioredoxin [Maritimibacter sp. HL-12]